MSAVASQAQESKASKSELKKSIRDHLKYTVCVRENEITSEAFYLALAHSVKRELIDGLDETDILDKRSDVKKVHYLSMEFLIGKCAENNLINLGLYDEAADAAKDYGLSLPDVLEAEHDPALGNGGLGRLAACFLDSMATTGVAGHGYGINYDFGLFRQSISNGYQKEAPDHWKSDGAPWLIERAHQTKIIPVYGQVFENIEGNGSYNPSWMNWQALIGIPYDLPITSVNGGRTNYLRLYSASASDEFDIKIFNDGDYMNAVEQKLNSEKISKILYPEDSTESGKELRLLQEYFFVACAIRDIAEEHLELNKDLSNFSEKNAIQLNDTHPALAVAEIMRLMVDEHRMPWDEAWRETVATCAYTNHTLLPEALERWPEPLLQKVLPRHLQIIREINRRFIEEMSKQGVSKEAIEKMKIIAHPDGVESDAEVRMANLSIIGSHTTNGVAALHTELVKSTLVPEFYSIWPAKFQNKTNGVTPRRWLNQANPKLSNLITDAIGDGWITDLSALQQLEAFSQDASFVESFAAVKRDNKRFLSQLIYEKTRIRIDHDALFDIQVKRIHEYKRQLLNVLQIIYSYLDIVENRQMPETSVAYIFSGKAAPGYFMAKRIIKLINSVAHVVNQDPRVGNAIKVAFIPDYRVSVAERIFPAANVSEQISTAGFEASGTGNMKFAMNGALTVGTMDGANVEIHEEVGDENIYIFGKTVEEIDQLKSSEYNPWDYYNGNPNIKRVLDALNSDMFCPGEPGLFEPLFYSLLSGGDYFCLLADLQEYIDCQMRVRSDYKFETSWNERAILNVARSGKFSSDRTITQYAKEIWNAAPSETA